jgi:hypothetical protein
MRTRTSTIFSAVVAVIIVFAAFVSPHVMAQKRSPAIKIGTYDSRIVIFAWSRTDLLKQHLIRLNQQNDSAQKAHDTVRIKELAIEAMSFQHLLHQMVFSTGSVSSFMAIIKDKLPELAKTTDVSMILSKWELNYCDPSFEVVDLTNQVAALFQPKENIDKMAAEISKQQPIPIDEFGIETDMLDGYCKMFGKK